MTRDAVFSDKFKVTVALERYVGDKTRAEIASGSTGSSNAGDDRGATAIDEADRAKFIFR